MPTAAQYQSYLQIIARPDRTEKLARIEFLNADGTVAFSIDNTEKAGKAPAGQPSRAFLQQGTLNVSLQNGTRRKANITLANMDGAFDYNVNNIWWGKQVRLMMGTRLLDGTEFYLPQGVFYFDSPSLDWRPNSRTAQYSLVDKWAYLDGSLYGTLAETFLIEPGENIFSVMSKILRQSIYTQEDTVNPLEMIDNITPIFTDYYKFRSVMREGTVHPFEEVTDEIRVEQGNTFADVLTALNDLFAGWIGYNATGALTVLPSQDDISDLTKPVLWDYSTNSKTFLGLTESYQTGEVYNDIIVYGENLSEGVSPYGRATNNNPASDTSVGRIGLKTYIESASGYYTNEQCQALANFYLKRMTVLQKSVTIESTQMFHLQENNLITVQRTDKAGSPVERHLIQSFSVPIAQNGSMSITATSVNDFPQND